MLQRARREVRRRSLANDNATLKEAVDQAVQSGSEEGEIEEV